MKHFHFQLQLIFLHSHETFNIKFKLVPGTKKLMYWLNPHYTYILQYDHTKLHYFFLFFQGVIKLNKSDINESLS